MLVRLADLPTGESVDFRDSSFFADPEACLPTPEEVRQNTAVVEGRPFGVTRPPPVLFKQQGLLVKYGSEITIAEAQCLWFFNHFMKDTVPTPEVYGWRIDGEETFIYMELVHGDTLKERWSSLSEEERTSICQQLKACVDSWRGLEQETKPYFIGHIGGQGVGDIIFSDMGDANAGPFPDLHTFHNFFAKYSCRRHPEWNPRRDFPELSGLTDDRAVVFTHADLDRSNIIISPAGEGALPRIVAIIDWHQSGWYPEDWEWLKAQWQCDISITTGKMDTAWLDRVVTPADEDYFYAWEYINSCLGC